MLKRIALASFALSILLGLTSAAAQAPKPPVKVACIGDSITFAAASGRREETSYPAQLQTLLGKGYEVRNYGVSGATMLRASERPYWNQKQYAEAKEFLPEIIVIKLGTNDSKPQHWNAEAYARDYRDMVEELAALPSNPRIILCRPVPAFSENFKIRNSVIVGEIIPAVDAIALEKRVPVVDAYNALLDHGTDFPDGIHPDAVGCNLLAKAVAEVVKAPAVKHE